MRRSKGGERRNGKRHLNDPRRHLLLPRSGTRATQPARRAEYLASFPGRAENLRALLFFLLSVVYDRLRVYIDRARARARSVSRLSRSGFEVKLFRATGGAAARRRPAGVIQVDNTRSRLEQLGRRGPRRRGRERKRKGNGRNGREVINLQRAAPAIAREPGTADRVRSPTR